MGEYAIRNDGAETKIGMAKRYVIESYDDDMGWSEWQSDSGLDSPSSKFTDRYLAEDELQHLKRRYGGKFRIRTAILAD